MLNELMNILAYAPEGTCAYLCHNNSQTILIGFSLLDISTELLEGS